MRRSFPFLCLQVAFVLCLVYVTGLVLLKSAYSLESLFVAAQLGGTEKFQQLREDARRHAKEFIRTHGGNAWFERDELDKGQPTVYVRLSLTEGYFVYPDGRVASSKEKN